MNIQVIEQEQKDLVIQAKSIIIRTQPQYIGASDFLKRVKTLYAKISEVFEPIIEAAHKTHKEAVAKKKGLVSPIEEAESIVKMAMLDYKEEQDRIARAEQERLNKEAERKQAELQKKADEARKKGDESKADKFEEKVAVTIAPIVASKAEKIEGISYREKWYAEITDLMALVIAVVKGKAPITFLQANMSALDKTASAIKGTMSYPGVKFIMKKIMASRGIE